ncbi:hypothetical protein BT63DRAFT_25569 [Microthyrium microscopicum]|uniref:Protein YAE1 n=1 Tax=Microthyrium microscopicum TaxID=703497 RepID=A0A6A6URV1_9PEZI|nr:hypothetical protein BT63DRAFT_25569 [Microthyrium microscopicum]
MLINSPSDSGSPIGDGPGETPVQTTAQDDIWDDVFEAETYYHQHTFSTNLPNSVDEFSINTVSVARQSPSEDADALGVGLGYSDIVSDVPRLRSIHASAGYREGVSESKSQFIQEGFDEGFALGGEIGRAVGWVLGGFDGLVAATSTAVTSVSSPESSIAKEGTPKELSWRDRLIKTQREANEELQIQNVISKDYITQEGLWLYDVNAGSEDIAFEEVAHAHPLVKKWTGILTEMANDTGLDLEAYKRLLEEEPV